MGQHRHRAPLLLVVLVAAALLGLPWGCGFPDYGFSATTSDAGDDRSAASPETGASSAGGQPSIEAGRSGAAGDARATGGADTGSPETGAPGCATDADCVGSALGSVCDAAGRACVQCLPGGASCGAGLYCTAGKRCEIGCAVDLDCVGAASGATDGGSAVDSGGAPRDGGPDAGVGPSPGDAGLRDASAGARPDASTGARPDASTDASTDARPKDASADGSGGGVRCDVVAHVCVGCAADGDCPLGTVCDIGAGRCVSGCTPGRACPAGLACCSGTCADLGRSPAHCGACDNLCTIPGSVAACVAGACEFGSCEAGFANCNADTSDGCEANLGTDPANCKACGAACLALPNADPGCAAGKCGLGPCKVGFEDCEGDPANGCETNLETNAGNCGGCGFVCDLLNASESCVAGVCQVANCTAGFEDCNLDPVDGCETNKLTDSANCGACRNACVFTNAAAKCDGGVCRIDTCLAPRGDCNGDPVDGCEANKNLDVDNCGACGAVCATANGLPVCSNGSCAVAACNPGWADCNGDPVDGCEVNVDSDPANCSACQSACSTNNATATCALGACSIACAGGFEDCDAVLTNGCEVDTTKSVDNCGGCGQVCTTTGGTANCSNSVCGVSTCLTPLADCDAASGNGCEVNTSTNVDNCGACGRACFAANGTSKCVAATCQVASCAPGYADCDGFYQDGCEALLSTPLNCGSCGQLCLLPNANTTCTTGTCEISSCVPPFADCDGVATNGCEANTETSSRNCGGCGLGCDATNGFAFCTSGVCGITCAAGYGNCDANVGNGCETATTNNAQNCGGCGSVCSVQNGTPACLGTTCGIQACDAGYANCDLSYGTGCEVRTSDDESNCGGCGRVCSSANGTPSCAGGACGVACTDGFGDCDLNAANGCETNLSGSVSNCGTCGKACTYANASATCFSGSCSLQACTAGFGDCDGAPANGCEASLATLGDCGVCGSVCNLANAAETCPSGACTLGACSAGFGNCDGQGATGCEVNTQTNVNHCGACGNICSSNNGSASCVLGGCAITCSASFGNCDGSATNGCEVPLLTSANCGACGLACTNANGTTACASGICSPSCTSGYASCDGNPSNGCETNTQTTVASCGACGSTCTNPNGTTSCVAGVCAPVCAAGYANCDGDPKNGCETAITTASNCGACGTVCVAANGTNVCTAGTCVPSCTASYGNCDGDPKNGCETNTATSIGNCGLCGKVCPVSGGTPNCVGGSCGVSTCSAGFGDCNGLPGDGCETVLTTLANCGACGSSCNLANATESCSSGTCALSACDSGFANCDGVATNGCEVNTNASVSSCGACGTACSSTNGTASCALGACAIACDSGFGNCDASLGNGCETNMQTAIGSCGACGAACTNPNGTTACSAGACAPVCSVGFGSCDGITANGCEVSLVTSASNCGGCGAACTPANGTNVCTGGSCAPTCFAGFGSCDGNAANGCETSLNTSSSNCGACGNVCSNAQGTTSCVAGACVPVCAGSFRDCDGNKGNGCETDTSSSLSSCGACGASCSSNNGAPSCNAGACGIACNAGFGNCDTLVSNGCEIALNTTANCGACAATCANANGSTACVSGACTPTCASDFASCDGNPDNGCEKSTGTLTDCGGCNVVCNLPNAAESCSGGTCTLGACVAGFGNCDGQASNGCETSTQTSVANCGACGSACANAHGTTACVTGACVPSCVVGWGDCDGLAANGCETNTQGTVSSCGACGNACSLASATAACSSGVCAVATCNAGFGNCDGSAANGCEANLGTSVSACGACGVSCTNPNGATSCTSGTCVPTCAAGYANCDGDPNNGCETNLRTTTDCGGCGVACSAANASVSCATGTCQLVSCNAGSGNCDGLSGNGCETSTQTSATHCGACGAACSTANGTATCTAGACSIACTGGFGNCNGLVSDGCETSLTTSASNCNACGTVCSFPNAAASCFGGACQLGACNGGYANCDAVGSNGCETSVSTLTNCGACGAACDLANAAESCASGSCTLGTCSAGFENCDGNGANGCEMNTQTSVANCGACGNACPAVGGTPNCVAGVCGITVCNPGLGDCNGSGADGCETNLNTSLPHCGGCGQLCSLANAGETCVTGVCTIGACAAGFGNCDVDPANGCETSTDSTVSSCGACGAACNSLNGTASCSLAACSIACTTGFGNCDNLASTGCEASLNTASNCGGCGTVCTNANGTTSCPAGSCVPACSAGFASCDGNPANGCEKSTATLADCGGCGVACNLANATETCPGGACTLGTCSAGYANCDADPSTGCETNLNTTVTSCGACGNTCVNAHGSTTCTAGACVPTCSPSRWGNCDGDAANGCETNTDATVTSCGACGTTCTYANAGASCSSGVCALGACNAGFGNCNAVASDGCEANLNTNTANCSACGAACTNANGTTTCTSGSCVPTCAAGFANCDGNASNGCEKNIRTLTDCGGCGTICDLANASETCASGTCALGTCSAGFGNCNATASDGCETNTNTSASNCSACGSACSTTNATPACTAAVCSLTCAVGFGNCNGLVSDGCETNTNTNASNCGGCGTVCSFANAGASCFGGACQLGACGAGYANCDGNAANGCETSLSTLASCGACGAVCDLANAAESCASQSCSLGACNAGFGNCNGLATDGCEIGTQSNVSNCGACGNVCSSINGTASCGSGACAITCSATFGNCDTLLSNGCEASLNTTTNCGVCGTVCSNTHGTTACPSGACTPACTAGWGNCDSLPNNGCETDTQATTAHCGGCGLGCTNANGTTSCSAGACVPVCTAGYGSCDANARNGCETALNTTANCGTCGLTCTNSNGTTACTAGACVPTCAAGFKNCDGNPNNGCETNTNTNVSNCNTCGNVCPAGGGTANCVGGVCGIASCSAGLGDCDGLPGNGCEVTLATSLANCGACGALCNLANASESCVSSTCTLGTCSAGFGNCNASSGDGCEISTDTSVTNCGACGTVCSSTNGTRSCSLGACSIACNSGYGNCDNLASTGCEVNLNTALGNCGACGTSCTNANGSTVCTAGGCVPTCNSGFGNCDSNLANGCETNLNTTVSSCGACGQACTNANGSTVCTLGACVPTCTPGYADCDGNPKNGCETGTSTNATNCGACGTICTNANGSTSCVSGVCTPVCSGSFKNCDGNANNGCETNSDTSQTHCGACGAGCSGANATATCSLGSCSLACNGGFGNCNGSAGDGCEVSLATNALNCGTCGTACTNVNGTTTCTAGSCVPTCSANYKSCDGLPNNGCERSVATVTDCSDCNTVCNLANAGETCPSGVCTLGTCSGGFGNCDANAANGCETNTTNSVSNCGACASPCTNANGTTVCTSSACVPTCNAGFGNCNAVLSDGCETNLSSTTAHCGGCGAACNGTNGTPSCSGSACAIACTAGYGNCDTFASTGCEVNLNTSTANCSACGAACTNAHGTTSCASGACVPSCTAPWGNCDGNATNGCETDRNTTLTSCGTCGTTCANPNGSTSCSSGACQPVCTSGYGNCDSNAVNGCETRTDTTLAHCGACGANCAFTNASATCSLGACAMGTCNSGFSNCDGNNANGCEFTGSTCTAQFQYTPSNFNPTGPGINPAATNATTTLNCGVSTFNSTTLVFGNWCAQVLPTPVIQTQAGGPDIVILAMRNFTLASASSLVLTGSRPVVLAVYGDATIAGIVDANATGVATPGAGGNWSCGTSKGADSTGGSCSGGSGGGGGGGHATAGANGGDGGGGTIGAGGVLRGSGPLAPLVGGCNGGKGGGCATDTGGAGGGAVQLSAVGTLTVSGTLRANAGLGANGACGCSESGGGGGGSGGAVLLEGNTVSTVAGSSITANGGKGGTGSGGPAGGNGGTGTTTPVVGGNDCCDGGAGGGGAVGRGYIRAITSCTLGGTTSISLAATANCGLPAAPPEAGCTGSTSAGRSYWSCTGTRTFTAARALCMSVGYNLVTINDATENTYISGLLGVTHWIGLTDRDEYSVEGTFVWQDKQASAYRAWNTGEPNNSGGLEDCAEMGATTAVWNDIDCAGTRAYVCEQAGVTNSVQVAEGATANLTCTTGTIRAYTTMYGTGCAGTCPLSCGTCTIGATSCSVTYNNTNCTECNAGCAKAGNLALSCQ